MIINSAPQNEAVLSNVGQIGEFRIRNSAKAFNILSSGLYANKIKAIIRELSCNAVDSHVAAGKATVPFDVHLSNALEPHFSIRDYGTGLSHEQVTNIYTTYFESTKTDSNAFIGALGLGSKSPFSYTDNFTVTAVKDNSKRIYTAFINEQGVPSIALMMEEVTDDPNGVEVKFSVNDRYDFDKFKQEARSVYKYFKLQPVISGAGDFKVPEIVYADRDIIPGVHSTSDNRISVAVMGNIAYPIDVPNAKENLGDLNSLLSCGLVVEFGIGEIDFQASREGLSYIPSTINAIKSKLEQLNSQLAVHIATEADKITNLWERAYFLSKKFNDALWKNAVIKYATDIKFELFNPNLFSRTTTFKLKVDELAAKYNIVIRNFRRSYLNSAFVNGKTETITDLLNGIPGTMSAWPINVNKDATFVVNDTKLGVTERAKYHFKKKMFTGSVYVLEKADKTKDMDTVAFFNAIVNPPESQIIQASTMEQKERAKSMGRNVTILKLESRDRSGWGRNRKTVMVWADAGKADSFDKNTTHYYVPLSGFTALSKVSDVKVLHEKLDSSGIYTGEIYGVRKGDMEFILTQKNWVNLDVLISTRLSKLSQNDVLGVVKQAIDFNRYFIYNVSDKLNADSPYLKMFNTFKNVKELDSSNKYALEFLCNAYGVTTTQMVDPSALIAKYRSELKDLKKRYPLIDHISSYSSVSPGDIAGYINLIDEKKGI
jgi:hypothetical protein